METINFTQTRSIEALSIATATPEEVTAFLAPTAYTFHHASPESIGLAGILHKKGEEVASAGRTFAHRDAYLVKVDGNLHPNAVRPQNMDRLFGIVL